MELESIKQNLTILDEIISFTVKLDDEGFKKKKNDIVKSLRKYPLPVDSSEDLFLVNKQKLKEYEDVLDKNQSLVSEFKEKSEKLVSQNLVLEKNNVQLQQKNTELLATLEAIRSEKQILWEKALSSDNEIKKMATYNQELAGTINTLEAEVNFLEELGLNLKRDNEVLKQSLLNQQREKKEIVLSVPKEFKEVISQKTKDKYLRQKIKSENISILLSKSERVCNELSAKVQALNRKLKSGEPEVKKRKHKISQFYSEVEAQSSTIKKRKKSGEEFDVLSYFSETGARLKLKTENEILKEEVKELKEKLSNLEENYQIKLSNYKENLNSMREFRKTTITDIENNIKIITDSIVHKLQGYDSKTEEMFSSAKKLELLTEELANKDLDISKLEDQISELKSKIAEAVQDLENSHVREEELREANSLVNNEKNMLEGQLSDLRKEQESKTEANGLMLIQKNKKISDLDCAIADLRVDKEFLDSLLKEGKLDEGLQGRLMRHFQKKYEGIFVEYNTLKNKYLLVKRQKDADKNDLNKLLKEIEELKINFRVEEQERKRTLLIQQLEEAERKLTDKELNSKKLILEKDEKINKLKETIKLLESSIAHKVNIESAMPEEKGPYDLDKILNLFERTKSMFVLLDSIK